MLSRVSDHFAYLPLRAGRAGGGGLGCALKGRVLRVAGGALVAGLAVLAMLRAQVFVSEEALWRDTLARNPAAWCAHANLGWILAAQQKYDEAREHLVASLQMHPDNAQAHSNLGRVLSLQGKFAEAEPQFQAALRIKPNDAEIRRSYASALAEQGRQEEAVKQLREALRLQPDTEARLQLAALLYQARKFREAVAEYRQVLAAKPDQPEALSNLAWLLATSSDATVRDGAEAVRLAEQACRLSGYKQAANRRAGGSLCRGGAVPGGGGGSAKGIEVARAGGDARLAAVGSQLLSLYRAGKPYHEPPPLPPAPVRNRPESRRTRRCASWPRRGTTSRTRSEIVGIWPVRMWQAARFLARPASWMGAVSFSKSISRGRASVRNCCWSHPRKRASVGTLR